MALNPEAQKKAQAEIESVVGSKRFPEPKDRENLPYIQAVIHETLRWKPVVPLNTPHTVIEDDEYEGYFIPKDTVVIAVSIGTNRLKLLISNLHRRISGEPLVKPGSLENLISFYYPLIQGHDARSRNVS